MSPRETGLDSRLVVARRDFELDVELSIGPGCTVALLGPNGAGKSTVVAALAGLVPLDGGHIRLGGELVDDAADVFVPPEERGVGVVFQDLLLFDHLDVTDNVAFGLAARGLRRREARTAARPWLERLGLADLADRRSSALSGGQAQRVALARALSIEPRLVLLDEPLAAVDVAARAPLRRVLRPELDRTAAPRLLITHDAADAFLLADEIHVLEGGRCTQRGTPDEIRRHPATPYVAALAGTNHLTGRVADGEVVLDGVPLTLHVADTHTAGPVVVSIHPTAVALHSTEPHGSPRNTWPTSVRGIDRLGEVVRVELDAPLPLVADVTPGAVDGLGLRPGSDVWAAVKATEIGIAPA